MIRSNIVNAVCYAKQLLADVSPLRQAGTN